MFNVTNIVANSMANTLYNCYLFSDSIQTVTNRRLSQFKGFDDVYTSFLFNLLSQSLQLKTYSTNVQTYSNQGSWYTYAETIAKIIRIVFDFESSDASSHSATMTSIRAAKALKAYAPAVEND